MTKYLYDIILHDNIVGDSGDMEFDTREAAIEDAKHFISTTLANEYETPVTVFEIHTYEVSD